MHDTGCACDVHVTNVIIEVMYCSYFTNLSFRIRCTKISDPEGPEWLEEGSSVQLVRLHHGTLDV